VKTRTLCPVACGPGTLAAAPQMRNRLPRTPFTTSLWSISLLARHRARRRSKKPTGAMLEKSLTWMDKGLRAKAHPRETFYSDEGCRALSSSIDSRMQQELLELELKHKRMSRTTGSNWHPPTSKLAAAADEKKDAKTSYAYNIRAILTIERAQKLGYMTTPKENFNLVWHLPKHQPVTPSPCDLLDKGLNDETIESNPPELAGTRWLYQLIHRDDKAIQTFMTGGQAVPDGCRNRIPAAQVYLGSQTRRMPSSTSSCALPRVAPPSRTSACRRHTGWARRGQVVSVTRLAESP